MSFWYLAGVVESPAQEDQRHILADPSRIRTHQGSFRRFGSRHRLHQRGSGSSTASTRLQSRTYPSDLLQPAGCRECPSHPWGSSSSPACGIARSARSAPQWGMSRTRAHAEGLRGADRLYRGACPGRAKAALASVGAQARICLRLRLASEDWTNRRQNSQSHRTVSGVPGLAARSKGVVGEGRPSMSRCMPTCPSSCPLY